MNTNKTQITYVSNVIEFNNMMCDDKKEVSIVLRILIF